MELLRHPDSGYGDRIGRLVAELAEDCVSSAARSIGVRHTRPKFGPRSVFTLGAEKLFTHLANTLDGKWPFTGTDQDSWYNFISGCLNEQIAIDQPELSRRLEDNGWEHEAASVLADRFFEDSAWLADRLALANP